MTSFQKLTTSIIMIVISLTLVSCGYFPTEQEKAQDKFKQLHSDAKKGNPQAQMKLATSYFFGSEEVKKDRDQALSWLDTCINQQYSPCMAFAGQLYLYGNAVDANIKKGLQLLTITAEDGFIESQNNLAWFFATNNIKELRNPEKALYWAKKMISNGSTSYAHLDTIAASFAANNQFKTAILYQKMAYSRSANYEEDRTQFLDRLTLYKNKKIFIEVQEKRQKSNDMVETLAPKTTH